MTPQELAQLRQQQAAQDARLQGGARKSPLRSTGGGGWIGAGNEDPANEGTPPPMPGGAHERGVDPRDTATGMGGAVGHGEPPLEFGPGDQSQAQPSFGDMMMASPAGPLIDAVRQSRASRQLANMPPEQAPTFGDAIARGPTQPG